MPETAFENHVSEPDSLPSVVFEAARHGNDVPTNAAFDAPLADAQAPTVHLTGEPAGVEDAGFTTSGELACLVGMSLAEIERHAVLETLASCDGNKAQAARLLGVSEKTIYNKLKQYRHKPR